MKKLVPVDSELQGVYDEKKDEIFGIKITELISQFMRTDAAELC